MKYKSKYATPEWQEKIKRACIDNPTMLSAAHALNISYTTLIRYAKRLGVYQPNQSRKGMSRDKREYQKIAIQLDEILKGLHPSYSTNHLKRRLLKEGLIENKCHICELDSTWNNKPLVLHLDHIDGNPRNHKRNNLRMLCPNCHSQTLTYAGRRRHKLNLKYSDVEIKNAIESSTTYKEVYERLGINKYLGQVQPLKDIIKSQPYKLKPIIPKNKPTVNEWEQEVLRRSKEALKRNVPLVQMVNESDIDFTKFGWVGKVAALIDKHPQKINQWMKKYMPDTYEIAFKRKQ